jgi:hypothetical protein
MFSFLTVFVELGKTTISFAMSARPHGTTRPPLDGFTCDFIFSTLRKSVNKIKVSLKYYKNNGYFI